MPDHCRKEQCVTLLSSHREDTDFVIDHINKLKLYVKIVWFGDNLRYVIQKLYDQNMKRPPPKQKSFIVLHWTPSEIIDVNIEYESIVMPKCEEFLNFNRSSTCKYELMPILMYCSQKLKPNIESLLSHINFDESHEKYLLKLYNNLTDGQQMKSAAHSMAQRDNNMVGIENAMNHADDKELIYDEIACKFIRDLSETSEMNVQIQSVEQQKRAKQQVFIGGIYPKKEEQENEYNG